MFFAVLTLRMSCQLPISRMDSGAPSSPNNEQLEGGSKESISSSALQELDYINLHNVFRKLQWDRYSSRQGCIYWISSVSGLLCTPSAGFVLPACEKRLFQSYGEAMTSCSTSFHGYTNQTCKNNPRKQARPNQTDCLAWNSSIYCSTRATIRAVNLYLVRNYVYLTLI